MAVLPELSVIIPVLNEAERIETLLRGVARQEQVTIEVILCDGGSSDETLRIAAQVSTWYPCELLILVERQGRARQMNAGAAVARGEWLLFLHADSEFPDLTALRKGISALREAGDSNGHGRTAGRFALRFDPDEGGDRFGYSFCEEKARLNRPGCILGDQGFLLSRDFFAVVGPFDETLPVAEDVDFAERVRVCGNFLLFTPEIFTSPRRFATEGYHARQTLNALLMGLFFADQPRFLDALPDIYRTQDQSRPLNLCPFFRKIDEMIAMLPLRKRLVFWYRIGSYVRSNAWQLAYALDVRRNYRQGMKAGDGEAPLLARYDRHLDRITDHLPGRLLTGVLVRVWFSLACRWLRFRDGGTKNVKRAGS